MFCRRENGGESAASTPGLDLCLSVPLRLRVTGSASGRPDVCVDMLQLSMGAAAPGRQRRQRRGGVAGASMGHL